MSSKHSVTLYRNGVDTKDGLREVFRVKAWDAVTAADGKVTFKLKLNAAMALPKGFADSFAWQEVTNADGKVTGHKVKALVYGGITSDKSGSLWLNPFMAVNEGERKWRVVDARTAPEGAKPMVFELSPWVEKTEEAPVKAEAVATDPYPF